MERNYAALQPLLDAGKRVILRTDAETYYVDSVDLLLFLLKSHNVILIIFDRTTRDLVDRVSYEGGDISRLRVIDAVSIVEGRGTPPVMHVVATYRPYDFNDMQVYTNLFAKEFAFTNVVVLYVAIQRLELYQNQNEIGLFMHFIRNQMKRYSMPEIILFNSSTNPVLAQIISTEADKIMPLHKQPLVLGGE